MMAKVSLKERRMKKRPMMAHLKKQIEEQKTPIQTISSKQAPDPINDEIKDETIEHKGPEDDQLINDYYEDVGSDEQEPNTSTRKTK